MERHGPSTADQGGHSVERWQNQSLEQGGFSLRTWMIWEKASGALRESRFLGLPSGQKRSCKHPLKDDSNLNNDCGTLRFPDLQCAWRLLLQCAAPRCNHLLRTVPHSPSAAYAAGHDAGMQQTMVALLGTLPGDHEQTTMAHNLASLPMRLGGLGLRSARRLASAACWASWGDAMRMLQERVPEATAILTRELAGIHRGCLGELHTACGILDREGFVGRPTWDELLAGARPLPPEAADSGEWQQGWEHYASSASEHHFRENVVLAQSHASDQATCDPTLDPELEQCSTELRLGSHSRCSFSSSVPFVLERLRLPHFLTDATCECGGQNDLLGRHRAACPRSGRLKRRAVPTEITLARVCREAGATVRRNVKLRDTNVHVDPSDEREVKVLLGSPSATGHSWPLTSPSEAR